MTNKITLAALAALMLFTQCDTLDELTKFTIEYDSEVTVPSSTVIINSPINLFTPAIQTNSESTFSSNDTRKDLVEEVKLTTMTLTLTSPADADFSFLKSIKIYMDAEGMNETLIASKTNISNDVGAMIVLDTEDTDLKEYIKKDSFTLRVSTTTDEAIDEDHMIDVHSEFFVDAKILGQ